MRSSSPSIPADWQLPGGWKTTRFCGFLTECHSDLSKKWKDMRLWSVRQRERGDRYRVVINHEEQYAIVHEDWKRKGSWKETKIRGSLEQCQDSIEEVWTDMRPLSVRKRLLNPG